jgi:ABC-type polysaccharide/polyol phosphate export permease
MQMKFTKSLSRDAQLIRLLVIRELTVRYKRSVIGVGWTLLNPMITSFVLWLVFANNFGQKLESGQQYAPYLMAGTLLNTFFSQGIMSSATSIGKNATILTKIYVKPQVFTLSAAISGLVNFAIGLLPLSLVCLVSGQSISLTFPLVILVAISLVSTVAGLGLVLSVIFIRFSDTANVTAVLLTMLSYLTPLFYPISSLSPTMQRIVSLNPITSYLDCFRWAFSNNASATMGDWIYIAMTGIFSLILGIGFFKRYWPRVVAML